MTETLDIPAACIRVTPAMLVELERLAGRALSDDDLRALFLMRCGQPRSFAGVERKLAAHGLT
jgi:hypothetical protein